MANVGDIYRVTCVCVEHEQVGLMVNHFQVTAKAGTGRTETQLATDFDSLFRAHVVALMSSGADYLETMIQKIFPAPILARKLTGTGTPGTATGDTLPRQTCGLITLTSDFAGKHARGRKYVPFPAEADNSGDGHPTAGYVTRLSVLAGDMSTSSIFGGGGNTLGFTPVIFNRANPGASILVTGATPRTIWATQRRRSDFGKANVPPA